MTEKLVQMYKQEGISLEQLDNSNSTPLELACIRGFDLIEDQIYLTGPLRAGRHSSYRYFIVKILLESRDKNEKCLVTLERDKYRDHSIYSPLHWAIYWGDFDLAELIIQENPLMLFMINRNDEIPFDMCYRAMNKAFYQMSILCIDSLLDMTFEAIMNSDPQMLNIKNYFKNKDKIEIINRVGMFVQRESESNLIFTICKHFFEGESKKGSKIFEELKERRLRSNRTNLQIKVSSGIKDIPIHEERSILEPEGVLMLPFYIHRVINWFAYFDRRHQLIELISKYHINPFKVNKSGKSIVHVLAQEGRADLLSAILDLKYRYISEKKVFSLAKSILIPTDDYLNSPLHLAAMNNHKQVFKVILQKNIGDVYQLNQRCITPIDLAPKIDSNLMIDMSYWDSVRKEIQKQEDSNLAARLLDKKFVNSYDRITSVRVPFDYAFIVRCDSLNISDSIVYKQMQKIQEEYGSVQENVFLLDIAYFNGCENIEPEDKSVNKLGVFQNNQYRGKNYFILLIRPTSALYSYMADKLDFKLFNTSKGFRQVYVYDGLREDQFEPLKHYEKQKIIMRILQDEFDLDKFVENGLILDHFPIHDFTERRKISEHVAHYFLEMLIDPLVYGYRPRLLIPFLELGLYHGLQNGYYYGFLGLLTAYMIPLGITGLLFYLYGVLHLGGLNNPLIPVFSIILSIWSSLFCHSWGRRENELAYAFDVHDLKLVEEQRREFKGTHCIDEITRKPIKYDFFTPARRRILVRFCR